MSIDPDRDWWRWSPTALAILRVHAHWRNLFRALTQPWAYRVLSLVQKREDGR